MLLTPLGCGEEGWRGLGWSSKHHPSSASFPHIGEGGRPCLFEAAVHSPLLRVSVIPPKGKDHFLRGPGEH